MKRVAMMTALLVAGCSGKETTAPTRSGESSITSLDLRPGDRGSTLTFDTGAARGIVEVEPGLATSYEMRSTTGGQEGTSTTATITVAGKALRIDASRLTIGERAVDLPSGEVRVEVKHDGIWVDGKKKSDF